MVYGTYFPSQSGDTGSNLNEIRDALNQIVSEDVKRLSIKDQIPLWINQRSGNEFTELLQAYYDWLYDESEYELASDGYPSVGFRRLIDVDETPEDFLKHFLYTYVPDFPSNYEEIFGTENEKIRDFINNVKMGLYQRKSNEDAFLYFLTTLFNADASVISFFYPKIKILRLNGGSFDSWTGATGDYSELRNLGGSYLNGDFKLQDGNFYQDFSYVLNADVDEVDADTGLPIYYDLMRRILHPAGMKGFFEKTESDYIPPDDYDGGFVNCEIPIIGNYFPYRPGGSAGATSATLNSLDGITHTPSQETLGICTGCSGNGYTHGGPHGYGWTGANIFEWGLTANGAIGITYDMPTYTYPAWADGITGDESVTNFEKIVIGNFVYLCDIENSLNVGITGCTAYGESTACFGS